jgi:hypothetical protein
MILGSSGRGLLDRGCGFNKGAIKGTGVSQGSKSGHPGLLISIRDEILPCCHGRGLPRNLQLIAVEDAKRSAEMTLSRCGW